MTAEGDGLGAVAAIQVALGKLTTQVNKLVERSNRIEDLWQQLHIVPLRFTPLTSANPTSDLADVQGPRDGYWWDVRLISSWGWTAGSVTITKNDLNGMVLATFPATGQFTWSGQVWLGPRDRMVATSTGLVGTAQIEGFAVEMSDRILPDYLL
jgi:hypothetical protein